MKTVWKILITFGVIALFMLVAFLVVFLASDFTVPAVPIIGSGTVAVIPIKGEITMGGCGGGLLGGSVQCAQVDRIKDMLKEAEDDYSVKAILLDVNSGGGYVVASRELMKAVKECKKPVVAWIGEAGASGAYYVASASDRIVADRDSVTGSIGVIMTVQQYYELFGKVGVNVTVIKSGKSKDIGSPYRPMTLEEEKNLQEMVDGIYYDFVSDVAENRNLPLDFVENISDGRIYLGSKAKELGLVDELGGFDDALNTAGKLGGIEGKPKVKEIVRRRSLSEIFSEVSSSVGYGIGRGLTEDFHF